MNSPSPLRKTVALSILLLCVVAVQAQAQDPTVVDSDHYTVIFENEQVRVVRITYGPGEESVMHYHPDGVVIFMEDADSEFTLPDGSVVPSVAKGGDVIWAPAGLHLPKNNSDTESISVILVELKSPAEQEEH